MNIIMTLIGNNLKIIFGKRSRIFGYIIIPILICIGLLVVTANSKASTVNIGIVDKDSSKLSINMIEYLRNTEDFIIEEIDEEDAESLISTRTKDVVLVIPDEFEANIYNNQVKDVELLSIKGESVTAFVEEYLNFYINNMQEIYHASEGDEIKFNEIFEEYSTDGTKFNVFYSIDIRQIKSSVKLSFGMFIIIILIICSITANLILVEKKERTYYRICSAPVLRRQFFIAHALLNTLIVFFQITIVMIAIQLIGIKMYIPRYQLLIVLMAFGLVAVSLSMMIVLCSKSSAMVNTLTNLIITPTSLIAGCLWPRGIMPNFLIKISYFIPQTWVIDAIEKLQAGVDFSGIYINISVILLFAVVFGLVAIYKINKNSEISTFV